MMIGMSIGEKKMSLRNLKSVIGAGIIGNSLEVYDYNLYGYYAVIFSGLFFNTGDVFSGLLATYGIFAAGFIMRPVGALVFGAIGDKWGRKKALELSILLMAIPTMLIGTLPGYVTIGIFAPLLLTLFRLLQGVAVGGELVGSFSFLIEHAPAHQRAQMGSWSLVGTFAGKMWASITVAMFAYFFTEEALSNWAWRIPFFLGLVFAFVGYRIRMNVSETPVFQEMKNRGALQKISLKDVVSRYKEEIFRLIGFTILQTVAVYLLFIYMPIYLSTSAGVPYLWAIVSNALSLALTTVTLPIGGLLCDKIGRKPVMLYGTIAFLLAAYPCFLVLQSSQVFAVILSQCTLSVLFAIMHSPIPAIYVELFPPEVRYTASAIAYNFSTAIFGGFTPLICTWLINVTGNPLSPVYWLLVAGGVSILSVLTFPETKTKSLQNFSY